ncbi:helix-turn-helix transcriptional regulator [Kineothrix sp. MB12-C1]|uniref:helix-turn-helix transcriptional regulator n=1 Tax=Kineothrix sp. MB12-C1 TaxID=3070215 RepID=UPI0027D2372D|nr:AraC family transcriptional regulator [Kineothrix sp. MB12-C1]WMC91933.1 AraC family transcriptional regulator [Kineothrix sp. MB12-C1]
MITVFNCGYDSKHRTVLDMYRPNGTPDYTLLIIKTEAFFEQNKEFITIPANTAILYNKESYVHYGCHNPNYNDDWIHFDFSKEDLSFFEELNIPLDTPCPLSYVGQLSDYARLVVLETHTAHPFKEQIIDSLMRALLYSLSSQIHETPNEITTHKYYNEMNSIRIAIANAPHKKWSIDEMAKSIHMSPSYFQHLYKKLFATSCMQEVIQARLKNACFYLRTTDMSIQSLASFCGYENELHFMRQFKKYMNMTPTMYRAHYKQQEVSFTSNQSKSAGLPNPVKS